MHNPHGLSSALKHLEFLVWTSHTEYLFEPSILGSKFRFSTLSRFSLLHFCITAATCYQRNAMLCADWLESTWIWRSEFLLHSRVPLRITSFFQCICAHKSSVIILHVQVSDSCLRFHRTKKIWRLNQVIAVGYVIKCCYNVYSSLKMRKVVLKRRFNFQPQCFVLLVFADYNDPTCEGMFVHFIRALPHVCTWNNLIKCVGVTSRKAPAFSFIVQWAIYEQLAMVGSLNGLHSRRISFNWKGGFPVSGLVV